jgi:hypothetical protein
MTTLNLRSVIDMRKAHQGSELYHGRVQLTCAFFGSPVLAPRLPKSPQGPVHLRQAAMELCSCAASPCQWEVRRMSILHCKCLRLSSCHVAARSHDTCICVSCTTASWLSQGWFSAVDLCTYDLTSLHPLSTLRSYLCLIASRIFSSRTSRQLPA